MQIQDEAFGKSHSRSVFAPAKKPARPKLVAAGMPAQAVTYWQRAGEKAAHRSANHEAIGHLTAGLAQLAQLPETQERAKRELALQPLLGKATMAARGYASPEALRAFSRARELCAEIGDDSNICPILFGVWLFELTGAHHTNAGRTADEFLERARLIGDPGDRLAANFAVLVSNVHLGNLVQARQHSEEAIRLFGDVTDAEATRLAFRYGVELGAASYAYGAWCYWLLGNADQALQLGNKALAISERVQHDYSRARGLCWNSALHAYRGEWRIRRARRGCCGDRLSAGTRIFYGRGGGSNHASVGKSNAGSACGICGRDYGRRWQRTARQVLDSRAPII